MNEIHPETSHDHALYCANHPTVETTLRCNRCEKPICAKCAVLTPTGYRCPECVRGQQRVFETAEPRDYFFGVSVAGVLGFVGGLIIPNLWIILIIFLAPATGSLIAELVRRVVQRRRSKRLFQFAAAAVLLGGFMPACVSLLGLASVLLLGGEAGSLLAGVGLNLLWQGLYAFIAASTTYYRLAGIQL